MVNVVMSVGFVRMLASWKPFVVNERGFVGALSGVQFKRVGDWVHTTVTDKYRIVSHADNIGAGNIKSADVFDSFLVPMSLIVEFASAVKSVKDVNARVEFVLDDESGRISFECDGRMVAGRAIEGRYPDALSLVESWGFDSTGHSVALDTSRVADFAKIVLPSGRKVDPAFKIQFSKADDDGRFVGSARFTTVDDDNFVALFQPNRLK